MNNPSKIYPTVGLWGQPVHKFRCFKAYDKTWHIVWPDYTMAAERTYSGEQALEILRNELRKRNGMQT